jgi:L-amino acid N-acyltransferase YncA
MDLDQEQRVRLKSGTEVLIRHMVPDDLERSITFFHELPEDDRAFLRVDVTRRDHVERRIREAETGRVRRLVALDGDRIVADGGLELFGHGWKEHAAELRLIVARDFQRQGLGMLMARELFGLAAHEKVEEIVVKMMRPQIAARRIFRKLGFREEFSLPRWVKDLRGVKQDLIVMQCDLNALWEELEEHFTGRDWQRTR